MHDKDDQYGEDFENESKPYSQHSRNDSRDKNEVDFYPPVKTSPIKKTRHVDVPQDATSEDLQRINDKMNDEVVLLINSLEGQIEKLKVNKKQDLEQRKFTEGLHGQDDGKLLLQNHILISRQYTLFKTGKFYPTFIDLKNSEIKVVQLK